MRVTRSIAASWMTLLIIRTVRARDFPTVRVLSRTPLIIRTVDQNTRGAYILRTEYDIYPHAYPPVYPFSFSALLPRILRCWVSFARAFLADTARSTPGPSPP